MTLIVLVPERTSSWSSFDKLRYVVIPEIEAASVVIPASIPVSAEPSPV